MNPDNLLFYGKSGLKRDEIFMNLRAWYLLFSIQ